MQIISYSPEYKDAFYEINKEWISSMFVMEDLDKKVLQNPEEMILDQGGHIFFVIHPEHGAIGTCALRKTGDNEFELTKMGVLAKARGLKAGEQLLQHVIQFVKDQKIDCCYLLTNKACEAAIHLYHKNGFVDDPDIMARFQVLYDRCNVAMRLKTDPA